VGTILIAAGRLIGGADLFCLAALCLGNFLREGAAFRLRLCYSPATMFPSRKPTLEPCLPRPAKEPPAGPDWIHEIKHDGFRIIARRDKKAGVRLFSRNGYDFTARFPKIAAAIESFGWRHV